jgi:hypothetical protein
MSDQREQPTAAARPLERVLRSDAPALAAVVVVVALVVWVVHFPSLRAGAHCFDDDQYLLHNPLVQDPSWSSAAQFLKEVTAPSTVGGYYQPLAMISIMGDVALGGTPEDLGPFHRTSLLLHAANTVLVIVLLYRLVGSVWAAGLVGLLFGVHPMTVEVVAWVGERKTPLATFFALGALVAYVSYARRGRARIRRCRP